MPQPDYDPNEPDEVWDYVQETYSTPWSWGDFEHRNCTPLSACDGCPARLNRHSAWPRETPWSAPIPSLSTQPRLLCAYCGQSL